MSALSTLTVPSAFTVETQTTGEAAQGDAVQSTVLLPTAQLAEDAEECHLASAGIPLDITIPDGTVMKPGEPFTKIWRLANKGSCAWSQAYAVVWFSGAQMSRQQVQYLGAEVLPHEMIDVGVDMIAPSKPGIYQSNWKLRSPDGDEFGIGPKGEAPFWVRIQVVDPRTPSAAFVFSPSATPLVYSTGKPTLSVNDFVDLDGIGQGGFKEADLSLRLSGEGSPQLVPENGARLIVVGNSLPEERTCRGLPLYNQPVDLREVESGVFLCYRTQVGLPGYARITYINLTEPMVTVEYLTWAKPN
ncbi:MAG: hypothetical protein HPY45_01705 [Anaerolineae bacterium]|nr:hypothetical protein [Anaerolineae bacterium]